MQKFIRKPSIDMYGGIVVYKDTTLEYKNESVEQSLKDLVFKSVTTVKGENYTSTYDTTINLKEGDILVFEEEGRGYIKPVEEFVTVKEAIEELEHIKDL
jgi:sporulation protein YlmC with PRC-barrel domain